MTFRTNKAEELRFAAPTVWTLCGAFATLLLAAVSATWYVAGALHRIEDGVDSIRRGAWTVRDARRYHNELQSALRTTKVVDGRLVIEFPPPYPPAADNE